jgi:hypothetical protein
MSDESSTPSLRLKPRSRPDAAGPAAAPSLPTSALPDLPPLPSVPGTPATTPTEANETTGLRLSPRSPESSADTQASSARTAPSPAAPEAGSSEDAGDLSRLKLKPRTTGAAPAPDAVLPPPILPPTLPPNPSVMAGGAGAAADATPVRSPAPPPSLPGGLPPLSPSAAKPPPFVRAPSAAKKPAAAAPENSSAFKAGVWVVGALLGVSVLVGGFLGFRYLTQKEKKSVPSATAAKPKPVETKAAEKPAEVASKSEEPHLASDPQSLAGKVVAKARDTVALREQSGQVKGVDDVLDSGNATNSTKPSDAVSSPVPKTAPQASTASAAVAARASEAAATPTPEPAFTRPEPTPAFRAFVINLRVSGVFQGEPGRALLNGKTIRVGEMVDAQKGIRLTRLEADRKMLYFEDPTGAEMGRRY